MRPFLIWLVGPTHHAGPAVHHIQEALWLPLLILVLVGLTGRVAVLPMVRFLGPVYGIPTVSVRIDEERVVVDWRGDRDPGVLVFRRGRRWGSGRSLSRRLGRETRWAALRTRDASSKMTARMTRGPPHFGQINGSIPVSLQIIWAHQAGNTPWPRGTRCL